jgi:hypothetical protein
MRALLLLAFLAIEIAALLGAPVVSSQSQAAENAKPGTAPPKVQSGGQMSVAVPLTKSECTALGGDINAKDEGCTAKGQFTCTTITINPVTKEIKANVTCIDK